MNASECSTFLFFSALMFMFSFCSSVFFLFSFVVRSRNSVVFLLKVLQVFLFSVGVMCV